MKKVGNIIREKREKDEMLLRHLAAKVDIDQAILSKIERGERKATKEQIINIANALGLNKDELVLQYLSENIANDIIDEKNAIKILQVAENKVEYFKKYKKIKNNET